MQNKKSIFILGIILMFFLLSGCSSETKGKPIPDHSSELSVETISDWSFQYNEVTNDYSLFFSLNDSNDTPIPASANVDIKIVNSAEEVLYDQTVVITPDDFDQYTNEIQGVKFLANIRIPKEDVLEGKASDGTVYFKVYNEQFFEFDECYCPVLYDLPVLDLSIISEDLPKEINLTDYDGTVLSTLLIENTKVDIDDHGSPTATITVIGTKTYEDTSFYPGMDTFDYQLCDSEGYMLESGSVVLNGLRSGDKFKDDSIIFFDLIPGEQYILKFASPAW